MKKLLYSLLAVMTIIACSKSDDEGGTNNTPEKPKSEINLNATSLDFATEGGSNTISFTSTDAWTAEIINTRADEWCSIDPTSGVAGNADIIVTTTANDTPDDRTASIIIKAGTTLKTVKVNQKQKNALTVTASSFEVMAEGGEVAVEVKANIDFEYAIEESAEEWVEYKTTRALKSSTLVFDVKKNDDAEKREAKIHIKSGNLIETITIYQAGAEPTIVVSQNEYIVAAAGETIAVEVASNVDVAVELPSNVDWISENTTRGVSTNTYYFDIEPSEEYDQRTADIKFTNKANNLSETVKIVQTQKDAIVLAQSEYSVPSEGGDYEVEILHNIDYDIDINVSWIQLNETRALEQETLVFTIEGNGGSERRTGSVTFTSKDENIKQTITFNQNKNSGTITSDEDNYSQTLDSYGGIAECPITTDWNLDELDIAIYGLNIGDEKPDWINLVENDTRAMNDYSIKFKIAPNESNETNIRCATVYISAKNTLGCIFRIYQRSPHETRAREVLSRFYEEMNGDSWPNNDYWCTETVVTNWYGNPRYDKDGNIYLDIELQGISGELTTEAVDGLYWVNLAGNNITAANIDGVESLHALCLDETTAKDVVVKNCTNLKWFSISAATENLEISNCGIDGIMLDAGADPNLYYDNRMLSTVSVDNCDQIKSIELYTPHLTSASIADCASLTSVTVRPSRPHYDDKPNGLLSAISIEECPNLENLVLGTNSISSIDIGSIPSLKSLDLSFNQLETIDLSKNSNLESLNLNANPAITSIDVSRNLALKDLALHGNPNIASLDVSGLTKLEKLGIGANMGSIFEYPNNNVKSSIMTTLKANGCASLKEIRMSDYRVVQNVFYEAQLPKSLSTLELAGCSALESLDVSNTSLKVLDLSDCYSLTRLLASGGMDAIYIPMYGENNFERSNLQISQAVGDGCTLIDFPIAPKEYCVHTSTDFSKDGQVRTIQRATVGNGINIVVMGEAFNDTMVNDGTYDEYMDKVTEALFAYEPFKSFRHLFNVYAVTAVSEKAYINLGKSALQMATADATEYIASESLVKAYAQKAVSSDKLENTAVIVAINGYGRSNCRMDTPAAENDYGCGYSVALCDMWDPNFDLLIQHEVVGHGFAKLQDEYTIYESSASSSLFAMEKYGWIKNLDNTNDLNNIKWAKFIQDSRYASEQLGAYEGGIYQTGVWHATQKSMMNNQDEAPFFNAPSREAIYYRIHKLAYGEEWEYDFETFAEWDARNR